MRDAGANLIPDLQKDAKETKTSLPWFPSVQISDPTNEERQALLPPLIVVSGASGFIGRRLAARVRTEFPHAELKCLVKIDDDPFCRTGIEFLLSRSIRPVEVELVGGRGLCGLQSPNILFHLAANTHTWEKDQSSNDLGTENLIRAAEPLGPDNHVIFTSTVAVMDNREKLGEPLRAETPVTGAPLSRYGVSKLRAEEHLKALARKRGFRLSVVRLSTVYGPQPRPNSLFDVLKREVSRRSITSRLNWPGLTSFVHVEDVVQCLLDLAKNPPPPGEPRVHLLATESRTLQQVSALLYQIQGIPFRLLALPRAAWELLAKSHKLCRWSQAALPVNVFRFFRDFLGFFYWS